MNKSEKKNCFLVFMEIFWISTTVGGKFYPEKKEKDFYCRTINEFSSHHECSSRDSESESVHQKQTFPHQPSGCENVPQRAGWTSASSHSDSLAQRLASLGELACLDKNEDSNAPPPRLLQYGLRRVGTRRVNSGTQERAFTVSLMKSKFTPLMFF